MPLRFPREASVRLRRSPLTEVLCQVRFPPILRIANEDPAEFQEQVRERFPRFEVEQGFAFQFQFSGGVVQAPAAQTTSRLYRFQTADGYTAITLTTDFYSLSTTRYTVWEEFAQDLTLAHEAVQRVYRPGFSARTGLRYVDHVTASKLGVDTFDEVVDVFKSELTALLRVDVWDDPAAMLCQLLLEDEEGNLGLQFGRQLIDDEPTFVLDFDYYDDQERSLDGLIERCQRYHDTIYDAFRWCIKPDKLDAFGPVPKEGA
jgi:uncharacterized protein (TIGR04255 family)